MIGENDVRGESDVRGDNDMRGGENIGHASGLRGTATKELYVY